MTKTVNELLFENLDATHYTTAKQAVADYSIFKRKFTQILGYDKITDGSVALQKGHQRGALEDELPSVQILKNNGLSVILLNELGVGKHLDCTVDGVPSEIKCVRTLSFRSLKEDFYEAHKKGAKRIILHIAIKTEREILIIVLKRIANNPLVNKLNDFFLIYEDKLEKHQLSDFK
jgi:hypothetical protein